VLKTAFFKCFRQIAGVHRAFLATFLIASTPWVGAQPLKTETIAQGLEHPWGMAFLPGFDGGPGSKALVTERPGRMRVVGWDGVISQPISGLPKVAAGGQGGLLDVALDPEFSRNRLVYWTFTEDGEGGNSTALARGRLSEDLRTFADVQVIFSQKPKFSSRLHFGNRIVFLRDGTIALALGDRFFRRDDAQTLNNHHGKIVRINRDGSAPKDNPFVNTPGALPEIWSIGHRNPQGMALHPDNGELWMHEHGPQGGDEINRIDPGKNYGWPKATRGVEYGSGARIGEPTLPGMVDALWTWIPSIAPSGMAFVTGKAAERFPQWRGNALVGALRGQMVVRIQFKGEGKTMTVDREERLLQNEVGRVRDVRFAPDGWLMLLTDAPDGKLIRVTR
jgi:aldose sugar dehydrogenase